MEHHAELPEVGGGGDRRVVQLFRRGVFEGQRAIMGRGDVGALELLGDAEVEQLDPAVAIDQQVGRLEVAMHDQVAMRITHRVQHLQEQHHALAQAEAARIAPSVDGFAIDALHHEIRFAVGADAAIEQGGDVGMLQAGQDLPFAQETFARDRRIGARADQLERGLLRVRAVTAFDRMHRAHAAAADGADDLPRADRTADRMVGSGMVIGKGAAPGRRVASEWLGGVGVGVEQRLDARAQRVIACAHRLERACALRGIEFGDCVEDRQRASLVFEFAHGDISASRNARALRQSRRRVRSLMPSISAISTSE